ncbi:MAG: hypothetical protein R6V12_10245 [Candidatus Hydrogenedentota bacterium]
MKKRSRMVTGLFVIVVLLFIWVYHLAEIKALERSLRKQADALMKQYASPENGLSENHVSLEVNAGKTLPILGQGRGKISVFTRTETPSGEKVYRTIEYFYAYEDGQWRMTESGGCSGPACQIRAEKAFREDAQIPIN